MSNKSPKRAEGKNNMRVVQRDTRSLMVPALEQVTSTVVSSSPASIPLFVRLSEEPVTRQEAQLFLDKLASVYLEHARMIVKTSPKKELLKIGS